MYNIETIKSLITSALFESIGKTNEGRVEMDNYLYIKSIVESAFDIVNKETKLQEKYNETN